MSSASFWGCDIGGAGNTHVARVVFDAGAGPELTCGAFGASIIELAQHVWTVSAAHNAPIILAIDAVLSYDMDSATGWRPADRWLKGLLDRRLASRPGVSTLVSPNAFMGHRHLELAETLGAYFFVAETHPGACLAFMGADLSHLQIYKRDPVALKGLTDWLLDKWFPSATCRPATHGDLDAVVCAMVAAVAGGKKFAGLSLFTPVLEDVRVSERAPRASLAGPAPFYVLKNDEVYSRMIAADAVQT
jgi:hypothetical protein